MLYSKPVPYEYITVRLFSFDWILHVRLKSVCLSPICSVYVLHLQTLTVTTGRPSNWRAACRTVIGAENLPNTKDLRIRLHPQSNIDDQLRHPGYHKHNPRLTP